MLSFILEHYLNIKLIKTQAFWSLSMLIFGRVFKPFMMIIFHEVYYKGCQILKWFLFKSKLIHTGKFIMSPNCNEHRKSMELLSLKMQLEKGISDRVKREEIKKMIEVFEKELDLDWLEIAFKHFLRSAISGFDSISEWIVDVKTRIIFHPVIIYIW